MNYCWRLVLGILLVFKRKRTTYSQEENPIKIGIYRNSQLEKIPSVKFEKLDNEFVDKNPEGYIYEYIWRYWTKK